MTRKLGVLIAICFVLSIGVVVVLAAISNDLRHQQGSFLREFPPHPVLEANELNLNVNSYYIAGGTPHHIYLANYKSPLHLLVVNKTLSDTQHVTLNVKGIFEQKFWAVYAKVDSPNYYLYDGTIPIIYKGNVNSGKGELLQRDKSYFQDILPITDESFYIRALGKPDGENTLGKLTNVPPYAEMKKGVLIKQVDGLFCTDGMMHYDKTINELVYLYRYRNEFITMDTSLNLKHRYHTIDTTTRAKIEVAKIESTGARQFASPTRTVNKRSCVWRGLLFSHSTVIAKNETTNSHDKASVIDVYNLKTGEYKFSFRLYDFQGKDKLRGFEIHGNKLFAMFGNYILTFDLVPYNFAEIQLQ